MGTVDLRLTPAEQQSILRDRKRHVFKDTSRARAWDTFTVNGERFEIIDVSERSLGAIASAYYPIEGCRSPGDFIRAWKARHSGDWRPEQTVFIHWFREAGGDPG